MISIAIRTAPRKVSYLKQTVQSLRSTFPGTDLHLFAEPDSPIVPGVVVHQNVQRLGIYANFIKALSFLVDNTEGPRYMVCEDDIALLPGFSDALADFVGDGLLNPYCAKPRGKDNFIGWYNPADVSLYGMLCLIFHESTVRDLLSIYRTERPIDKGADSCIGLLTNKAGCKVWQHTPTLVDHLGEISTIVDIDTLPPRLLNNRKPYYGRNFNCPTSKYQRGGGISEAST